MKKITTSLLLLCICVFSAYSQTGKTEERKTNHFLIGKFWDNWFVSSGAGANLYIGDYNSNLGTHLTPSFNVAAGKWITPAFGVRLQYNGVSMNATGDPDYWYTANKESCEQVKFGYHAFHTDFMVNLSRIIGGYKPDRRYQLIPFFGWGWSQSKSKAFPDRKRNEYFAIVGLKNNLRVSNSVDLHLELSATAVSQRLAGHMIGGKANYPLAATFGFTYHFGGENARRWKTCGTSSRIDITTYQNQINTLDANNVKLQAENEALKKKADEVIVVEPIQPKVEKVVERVTEKVFIPVPVFFDLNKWDVNPREVASLRYMAEYIIEYPQTKFVIKGYADSQTGNPTINYYLSKKRAEAIIDVLIKKYGIKENQIEIDANGGVPDLFEPSELNRVVVIVLKE